MLRALFILAICLLPKITKPQSVSAFMGARAAALGYASSTLGDEWSLFNNIGGTAMIDKSSVSFAYASNPNLPGANHGALALNAPLKSGCLGTGFFRFGDEIYNEQIITTGYSNQFGLASLGLTANYIQYRAEGFGTKTAVGINFGGVAKITNQFIVGAHITNLNQPRFSDSKEHIPSKMVAGVQFKPQENLSILSEIEKDLRYKPTLKAAMEYGFLKKFTFRTGFNLNPYAASGGIGFRSHRFKFDYAINYTQFIRTQFQISTSYQFKTQ